MLTAIHCLLYFNYKCFTMNHEDPLILGSKVKVTSGKKCADVDLCTIVNDGSFYLLLLC